MEEHLYLLATDKSAVRKINELLIDIQRNGNMGIGKPEPLIYRKAWSGRIDHEHRVVSIIEENKIILIMSLKEHH